MNHFGPKLILDDLLLALTEHGTIDIFLIFWHILLMYLDCAQKDNTTSMLSKISADNSYVILFSHAL